MITVYVVIVTFNGEKWVRGLLTSLQKSLHSCQVIVVDNSSTDSTVPIIRGEFPEVELIVLPDNRGFGIGNNIGISHAISRKAEHVFLLNQDAYVTPETILKLSAFLSENPGYGVATPLHCSPDVGHVDTKTLRVYLQKHATAYLSDACLGQAKKYYSIRGINAAAWYVRASVFMKVGGFDPLFFMYGEDDDLIGRFAFHQVEFALVPDAKIVHLRETSPSPVTSKRKSIEKLAARARSFLLIELKAPRTSVSYMISLLLAKGIIAPIAAYIIERNGSSLAASFIATARIIGELPKIRRHAKLSAKPGAHFLSVKDN